MKTDIRTRRRALLASAAAPAIALALMATSAGAQEPAKTFSIAPQPLADALLQLSRQADVDIVASTDLTRGRVAPKVDGQMTTADAMSALLAGSGLVAAPSGTGYVITRASDPQSGSAAGDGADSGTVQALVVTAQKREENIQDVPIAMSAFTQEDLTRSQVAGGPDLMTQVPNFTFTKTNFTGYSIQIRGIGTQAVSATTDAAVAVAENNTPFIRNRFFEQEFYDLERVEVLRGPQGTLYGRNATAGVVNILTAKPKFRYEAKLAADLANYNSSRLEGMVNVPLVEDKVALRLAGAWTKRDGYDVNELTGGRIDGRDLWSTRLSLRMTPTENIDVNLIWEHFEENDDRLRSGKQLCHTDARTEIAGYPAVINTSYYFYPFSQGCLPASLYGPESYQTPNGWSLPYIYGSGHAVNVYTSSTQSSDLRVIESTVDPQYRAKNDIGELQLGIDLGGGLSLTSETAYAVDSIFSTEDYNRFNAASGTFDNPNMRPGALNPGPNGPVFCDPQVGCADHVVVVDDSTARSRQFSEEMRLASDYTGPFNFSLGANFVRYDTMEKYYVFLNTVTLRAVQSFSNTGIYPDWPLTGGDNYECLMHGMELPDFTKPQNLNPCVYIDPNPIGSLNDQGHNYFLSKNPYKLISYAVFGEAYYKLADNLKLTAGLRWTVDKKEAPRIPSWLLAAQTVGYPVAGVERQEWREPTGRLAIDWTPDLSFTDQTLLYGSYSRGYKAGGANPPPAGVVIYCSECNTETATGQVANSVTHPKTFGPEFVNAYEIGTKNTLLDGRLTLNGDAFFYDYTGYQISQIVDRSATNYNVDAHVWGLELEADWRPLENLRLGFKGGYENTRIADGTRAVDVMDRTAGHDDWVVVRPFPTFPSNCIVPVYTLAGTGNALTAAPNEYMNGQMGPCEFAYVLGLDPVSQLQYVPNPTQTRGNFNIHNYFPGYVGFDPLAGTAGDPYTGQNVANGHDYGPAPNGGAGFFKDLSGNELPNAPHFTATFTADYTIPLPSNWLMTLHGDFYYQSEAWTRIFNTPGYDKLKAYTNVNLAAIFSNEDAGWQVMAYVKNVFDKDNITGAFLNSDDTGLTTNIFLNEPRLYGLRVTKNWTGEGWWTGANGNHPAGTPYPFTVEIGGEVQHQDDRSTAAVPEVATNVLSALPLPSDVQHRPTDWGDERSIKLTYAPQGSSWFVSGAYRYGRTNNATTRLHKQLEGDKVCAAPLSGPLAYIGNAYCDPTYSLFGGPPGQYYSPAHFLTPVTWSDNNARNHEEHEIVDFVVGKEVGLGAEGSHGHIAAGVRYAHVDSDSQFDFYAGTEQHPEGWKLWWLGYTSNRSRYEAHVSANREFSGAGPVVSWDAGVPLMGTEQTGRLNVDWSVTGGVLFGRQHAALSDQEQGGYYVGYHDIWPLPPARPMDVVDRKIARSNSASVPVLDLSLGLSYEIQRLKLSTGYRWERYFNAIDGGVQDHKSYDRTIDGPYFKIAVGFGG
ncbi:MAG: TonB-dependent receptor domain-containing protein [Parcubacteria group bacterium]